MMDPSWLQQCKMNADLSQYEKVSRQERAALRRAAKAERAFRIAKGYEKDTLWSWLKWRFVRKNDPF